MKSRLQPTPAFLLLLHVALILTAETHAANSRSGMDVDTIARYEAASPLNHTVRITRMGSVLKLDYELIGTDGKEYNLWDIRDGSRPAFSVYQGNTRLGGGTFEFG